MRTCNILIVDDDSDDRDIFLETFQQIGVENVYGVASAEAAIVFLQKITEDKDLPKLIITDVNMPSVNGLELLRVLKQIKRYQQIPIIVCSTSSAHHHAEACLAAGATDYITKPSTMSGYLTITRQLRTLVLA